MGDNARGGIRGLDSSAIDGTAELQWHSLRRRIAESRFDGNDEDF